MKSVLLHKWERRTHLTITIFFGIFLMIGIVNNIYPLKKQSVIYLIEIAYLVCLGMIMFLYFSFRKWKKAGFENSKLLGLKRVTIFPTTVPNIYELHHRQNSIKVGLMLRKHSKKKVINTIITELRQDFRKLAELSKTDNTIFVSITHAKMAELWEEACTSYFDIVPTNTYRDPYVKPLLWQWWLMSFATTGRIASLPKKWGAILFYSKRGENSGNYS